ncbi:hypothetical protein ACRRTK_018894 [Alexandromys fortis]
MNTPSSSLAFGMLLQPFRKDGHEMKEVAMVEDRISPIRPDNASQMYTEELCYVLVDHKALGGRPPGNSAEGFYENVSSQTERHRESSREETEYSVLRFSPTPQSPPSTEDEYELLVPSTLLSHAPQQPRPFTTAFETHFSHLK